MKKYDEAVLSLTVSINNELEERKAQRIFNQRGHCHGISCTDCPFKDEFNTFPCQPEIIFDVLKAMGFKKNG